MVDKQFLLDPSGKCMDCALSPAHTDIIKCATCKQSYHALCSQSTEDNFICRMTFLKAWHAPSVRSNFQWHCDSCLTKWEEKEASTMEDRFEKLVDLVKNLTTEVQTVKSNVNSFKTNSETSSWVDVPCDSTNRAHINPWQNQTKVSKMKTSLVLKNKPGSSTDKESELAKVKELAVCNGIAGSTVGFDLSGNTFIDCPSQAESERLQPILANDFQGKHVSTVKGKLPCISITGIQDEVTKSNLVSLVCKQNPKISMLVNNGEDFNVLFVKSSKGNNSEYVAVARVSPKIRDAIRTERNRIFLGITSCRIYDRFHVKRCNNCQEYGHFKDSCQKDPCCAYCSGPHSSDQCSIKSDDKSLLKCVNCKKENPDLCSGHTAFDPKCPTYRAAQKRMESSMPYYQGLKSGTHLNLR